MLVCEYLNSAFWLTAFDNGKGCVEHALFKCPLPFALIGLCYLRRYYVMFCCLILSNKC